MARQKGILPIEGTIGNITFYKTKDGYLVKEKSELDANRIATDPAFERTRENNEEFRKAGKAAKTFRLAFREVASGIADYRLMSRLIQIMAKIVKMDAVNPRGLRRVMDGETTFMEGFEFNKNAAFEGTFNAPFSIAVDKTAKTVTISIPDFTPTSMVVAPEGTTHFRIVSGAAAINFESNSYTTETKHSGYLAYERLPLSVPDLVIPMPEANSDMPWFVCLGIELYQEVNNHQYPLKNGAFNALSVARVEVTV